MLKVMNIESAKYLVELLDIKNIIVREVKINENKSTIIINNGKLIINANVYNLNQATNVAIIDAHIKDFIRAYLGDEYELISNIKRIILQMVDLPFTPPLNKITYIGIKKKVFVVIKHDTAYYAVNLVNGQFVFINKTTTKFFKTENEEVNIVLLHDLRKILFKLGELVPITVKLSNTKKLIPIELNNFPQCL